MRQKLTADEKAWIENPADLGVPVEVLHRTYYDYKTILGVNAGSVSVTASYSFFNTPSGTPVGAAINTKEDSNIPKPLAIGSPYKFLIQDVGFVVMPFGRTWCTGSAPTADKMYQADVMEILSRGVMTLKILGVDQLEMSPLMGIPSGIGENGSGAGVAASGTSQITNGWAVQGNRYPVSLQLYKDTSFEVLVEFPKGTFPVYNYLRMGVILDGLLQRPKSK
jgi:hypothetical protein